MSIFVKGEVWHWRGPSPFHFIRTNAEKAEEIQFIAGHLSYGWGCIPTTVRIGETTFTTALIPKDGIYLVPLKNAVRSSENIAIGQLVTAELSFP